MGDYENKYIPINKWAEGDRPREKLLNLGRSALSDAELIAILLGSGSRELSAVELAKQILANTHNNLAALGKESVKDLMQFKGVGEAKAISIVAALELGRRRGLHELPKQQKISSSRDAFEVFKPKLSDLTVEQFWVMLLNRANKVIKLVQISKGGVSGTVADPKIIMKAALQETASSIILCHNHPSGNLNPSHADLQLTKKINEACKNLDISLLDHVIIGENDFFSFADEGHL